MLSTLPSPFYESASSSGKRTPAFKTPLPLDLLLGHIQSTPQLWYLPPPSVLLECLCQHPCPRLLGSARGIAGPVACSSKRRALLPSQELRPLPSRSWDRAGGHPGTQNKMTKERKQTKTDESHPGWKRRGEAPLRGRGLIL